MFGCCLLKSAITESIHLLSAPCQKSSIFSVTSSPETSLETPLGVFAAPDPEPEPPGAQAASPTAVARKRAAARIRCRFVMPVSSCVVGGALTLAISRPVMPDAAQFRAKRETGTVLIVKTASIAAGVARQLADSINR